MKRNKTTITIHDVARAAGVSVSTVSRVLNNKDDVSSDTYEKVQGVIAELGYASSLAAKSMRSRRTNVIGLIMPNVEQPFPVLVMKGVNRAIVQFDYDLLIYTNGDIKKNASAERERYYVSLLNTGITDGVIMVTPAATSFPTSAPVVAIDPNNENTDCPAVIATNHAGALAAMGYLTGLGHRRIGFIGGRLDLQSAVRRLQGYEDGLVQAGILFDSSLVETGDFSTETAVSCAHRLLDRPDRPTAIFAANDGSAFGVYQAAQALEINIPDDLSVIGFDNIPEAACVRPGLTTVEQSIEQMGYTAAEILMKLIRGQALEQQVAKLPTKLVVRDSCRAVSG